MATNKGKTGSWANPAFLHDLVMCFYGAGTDAGVMGPEIRQDIEARMKALNHQVTWEGIRQHIQKLRRGKASPEKAALDGGDIKTEQPPSTPTPRKRKTPTPKKKGATPAKSAAYVEQSDEEGDMLPMKDEAPETPRRKRVKNESDEV